MASALENPDGFRLFHTPAAYIATRIENICEIALFASIGYLAILLQNPNQLRLSWKDSHTPIMIFGPLILLLMFATGAFRTGETARAALFIYPYLLMLIIRLPTPTLRLLLLLAGLQTLAMQLLGEYHW